MVQTTGYGQKGNYPYTPDFTKGMISESWKMGVPHYYDWVMTTTLPKKATLHYFDPNTLWGKFANNFTKCPWWVILMVWVPHILWLSLAGMGFGDAQLDAIPVIGFHRYLHRYLVLDPYFGRAGEGLEKTRFPIETLFGFFFFSFFEWAIHKYMFHRTPQSKFGNSFHFIMHGAHHLAPMDTMRLVFPPFPCMILRLCLGLGFWVVCKNSMTYHSAMAGIMWGYISYDLMHYMNHHANFPSSPMLMSIKRHHLRHHFHGPNELPCNFALSYLAMFWDKVFQTGCGPRDTGVTKKVE